MAQRPVTAGRRVSVAVPHGVTLAPDSVVPTKPNPAPEISLPSHNVPVANRPSYSGILTHIPNEPARTMWRDLKSTVHHHGVAAFPNASHGEVEKAADGCVRLVVLSDTHRMHRKYDKLPAGDILVHCGDFTDEGTQEELADFADWLGRQTQFKHRLVIAGNHDRCLDSKALPASIPTDPASPLSGSFSDPTAVAAAEATLRNVCTYVKHDVVEIEGLRFFASPHVPMNDDNAFGYNRHLQGHDIWKGLATAASHGGLDVVVTHGPPLGHSDMVVGVGVIGCADLLDVIEYAKPMLHLFGHVHRGRGMTSNTRTLFINAASVAEQNEDDDMFRTLPPFVVDVPTRANEAGRQAWNAALAAPGAA